MASNDFIPRPDADFNLFQGNLLTIVGPNMASWGILKDDYTALTSLQTLWTNAFAKASNKLNRTSADVQAKDDARAAFEKALRTFIAQWLTHNTKVPDSERERMGLTVKDHKHTLTALPASSPVGTIDFSVRLQHTIEFTDDASPRSKAKPAGVQGCEIWMKLGGEAPRDATELAYLATDTRTPYVAHFTGADAGKTAWYWLRWINTTGQPGSWGSPMSAMVVG